MKLFYALLFSSLAISMEAPLICYLVRLPIEVQNIIGEYLISEETDEELVSRNAALGWGSDYHRKAQNYERINGTFSGNSWNYEYDVYYDRQNRNKTQLLVRHQKSDPWESYNELARIIYDDEEYPQIVDITVSSDGAFFAKMAQKKIQNGWDEMASGWGSYTYSRIKITVYQLANNAKKEFIIPGPQQTVLFVGINTQNTKVITRGCQEAREYKPYIFSFKKEYEKTNNRLNDYFKQNRVCKKLASSLSPVSEGDKNEN